MEQSQYIPFLKSVIHVCEKELPASNMLMHVDYIGVQNVLSALTILNIVA